MNTLTSRYPEFVQNMLLDMLVGTIDYQKTKYQQVLNELTRRLSKKLAWEKKVFQLEQRLAGKADLSSMKRYDMCSQVQCLKHDYKHINTIIILEYKDHTHLDPDVLRVARSLRTYKLIVTKVEYAPSLNNGRHIRMEPIMKAISTQTEHRLIRQCPEMYLTNWM